MGFKPTTLRGNFGNFFFFSLHYFTTFFFFSIKEQGFSCRGGLSWWREFLIVPCYNFTSSADEVGLHYRHRVLRLLNIPFLCYNCMSSTDGLG